MHSLSNSLKFGLNYKIFGKIQAKTHWKTYEQTLSNFSTTLLLSQASIDILFHTTFLSVSEFMVKSTHKHLVSSGSSCVKTLLWQKQTIPAHFFLKRTPLLLISVTLLYLSTIWCLLFCVNHICVLLAKKLANQKQVIVYDENIIATPHEVTQRQKTLLFSLLCTFLSLFFVFVCSLIDTTTGNLQGLTHSSPVKKY